MPHNAPGTALIGFTALSTGKDLRPTQTDGDWRQSLRCSAWLLRQAVARAANVSPAYISRIMNETDPLVGSAEFYRRLEACLGQIIDQRQRQFFRVAPADVRSVERAARDVLDIAA